MGEAHRYASGISFDRKLKLEFRGTKVNSDACLPAYHKFYKALGLTTIMDSELCDKRTGNNTQKSIIQAIDIQNKKGED
jgi:hypothetical protein